MSFFNLAIIQVAEPSDDLLLVQLVSLQLHPPHGLHGVVILQALLPSHHHLSGWSLIQFVDITFLKGDNKYERTSGSLKVLLALDLKLTFISKVAWVVKSA